ncbi:MAG: O-antigen ligase family protein [Methyloglobulus sp.]
MSELIRTFIVVVMLSGATFWVTQKALPEFVPVKEFKRWRNAWLILVVAAFFAQSIWLLFTIITAFCIFFVSSKQKERVIYYLLLLCALPMFPVEIPGFAGIRYIINVNYVRLLTLVLLLGIYLKNIGKIRLFYFKSDAYILAFVVLTSYLSFRDNSFTNGLREFLMNILDILIPYLVLSRFIDNKDQLNRAFVALLIGIAPFALMGIFETLKSWHLFVALKSSYSWGKGGYDIRDGSLRASAIFASPIVLGYVLAIAFGLLLYLQPLIKNQRFVILAGLTIFVGLLATVARGPWIGFAFLCCAYMWTGREAVKKIALWGVGVVAMLPILAVTPYGEKFINLLPFIGTTRADTVDYRKRLIENAWIVFKRHPWLGSTTYRETPEMESMRQGQGIIDLVNSYIGLVLPYGIVGLSLFLIIFLGLSYRCYFILKRIPPSEVDLLRMGRALFAILASIMLMIATVSSIDYIPVLYWTFAAIVAAYLKVVENTIRQHRVGI